MLILLMRCSFKDQDILNWRSKNRNVCTEPALLRSTKYTGNSAFSSLSLPSGSSYPWSMVHDWPEGPPKPVLRDLAELVPEIQKSKSAKNNERMGVRDGHLSGPCLMGLTTSLAGRGIQQVQGEKPCEQPEVLVCFQWDSVIAEPMWWQRSLFE